MAHPPTDAARIGRLRDALFRLLPQASALVALALALIYGLRPDAAAAITVFPVWIWIPPAIGALLFTMRARPWRSGLVLLIWIVFLFGCADEPVSLLRGAMSAPPEVADNQRLRVITFNCGGVNTTAELIPHRPDVVLLQESPSSEMVARFAAELFGQAAIVWTNDARWWPMASCSRRPNGIRRATVARGLGCDCGRGRRSRSSACGSCRRWCGGISGRRIAGGPRPTTGGSAARSSSISSPAGRRSEANFPRSWGGDFNAPAGDGAMDVLRPGLTEAGRVAGRGSGNTITNEFPVLRIDQVWTSPPLEPLNVTAHRSRGSDHRFVICDLRLPP